MSGGADSLALMLLAEAAIPGRFEVATVDHGLRPEAARETAMVAETCEARGIRCAVLRVSLAPGNVQQQARLARYEALGRWAVDRGLVALATAHHADDQAETLLMRLNRGSGLGGLAGIRPSGRVEGCAVPVIRPLLGFRRSELAAIVAGAGLEPVDDPSNRDEGFDRVRIRNRLAEANWLDPAALAHSASLLGEVEDTLSAMAGEAWTQTVVLSPDHVSVGSSRWREIEVRLLERAFAQLGPSASRGDIAALLDRLGDKHPARANLAGILVERREGRIHCRPEPARRSGGLRK